MTEDLQLHDDLTALAAQVGPATLDLPALQDTARRRVRRRRLLGAGPAVLVLLAAGLVLPGLLRDPQDRLATATAAPTVVPRLSVTATLRAPATPGLSVRVGTGAVTGGEGTRFPLTWSLAAGSAPLPVFDVPGFTVEVAAERGPGVVGVTDGRCFSWDGQGRGVPHRCPAAFPVALEPGTSTTTDLLVAEVVESGSIADGTYRFRLTAGDLGIVDLVLTVTGSHGTGGRPVPVSGHVAADHGRGLVGTGRGPVAAVVALRSARSGATTEVTTADGSWTAQLPPGRYRVTVTIADGTCPQEDLDVRPGTAATLDVTCQDGASTF